MAVFYALAMITVIYLFFIKERPEPDKVEKASVIVDEPAMVVIDTADIPLKEAPDIGEPVVVSQNTTVEPQPDEADSGDLRERLKNTEGLLPSHDIGYIFVGDSRFVHMNQVCKITDNENLFVVAKVGEGYSWFTSTALPQIKRIISTGLFKKWKVVICLGINDLENLEQYEKKYNGLKDTYDISLISVNPITSYGTLSNTKIESFNSRIKTLDFPYIDTFRLLQHTGYTCTDGLHYDADTSKKIFTGILMGLEDENPGILVKAPASVLDKASLSRKKSLQREITETNKYIPKQISSNLLLPEGTPEQQAGNEQATENGESSSSNTDPPAQEPEVHQLTQEEIDALYGKSSHDDEDEDEDDEDDEEEDD